MEGFYNLRNELKDRFHASVENGASETKFIDFIDSALRKSNKFDIKALEVVLDLAIGVVDDQGNIYCDLCNQPTLLPTDDEHTDNWPPSSSEVGKHYDADDESSDETFIFPCHMTYENCHPDQLVSYHSDHIRSSRTSTQIIKHSGVCEFVFKFLLENLRSHFKFLLDSQTNAGNTKTRIQDEQSLDKYLNSIILIIKRVDRVCSLEKNNSRILSKTGILDYLLNILEILVKAIPQKQESFLGPLLKFTFILADHSITSHNLKQLFSLIKEERLNVATILTSFESILNHHDNILKNIQPMKSINFPVASTTADELYSNSYISNSWHCRLRRKVIEFKKRQSRSVDFQELIKRNGELTSQDQTRENNSLAPSWLECSLITPLSNVSSIIHNGLIKFSCSLWISICGDLFVIDKSNYVGKATNSIDSSSDWRDTNGYWLKLISRRRLAGRYKNRRRLNSTRVSMDGKTKKAHDKEDEDLEEQEQQLRKIERATIMNKSSVSPIKLSSLNQIRTKVYKSSERLDKMPNNQGSGRKSGEPLCRRMNYDERELMLHIISFAIDTLTIEIWLNVKRMTLTAKACRVGREGQTSLLDQVVFPSHLEANGNWSNLIFCLEEESEYPSQLRRTMHLRLTVDGIHNETEKLIYNTNKSPYSNFACLLGCERSSFGYVWKLAHVSVYKSIPTTETITFLLGRGPDFSNFTDFKNYSTLPMPDIIKRTTRSFLRPKFLDLYSKIDEGVALNWLTRNVLSIYSTSKPLHFLDFSKTTGNSSLPLPADHELSNTNERFIRAEILNFSRSLRFNVNQGFGPALVGAGGIESVMICFADVIRRYPNDPKLHSLALSILFKMSQTNHYHLSKFLDELNGLKLIQYMLVHPNCVVSKWMLEDYLDYCLIRRGGHKFIKSSKLLFHLLSCWKAWHKDIRVAKRFYRNLISLLQPKDFSPRVQPEQRKIQSLYYEHNHRMISEAGGIDILISILKECLVPLDDHAPKINRELIELIVNLISILVKHPPGVDVMYEIMEFLIFIHPDPKAFVDGIPDKTSFLHSSVVPSRGEFGTGNMSNHSLSVMSEAPISGQSSQDDLNRPYFLGGARINSSSDLITGKNNHPSDRHLSDTYEDFNFDLDIGSNLQSIFEGDIVRTHINCSSNMRSQPNYFTTPSYDKNCSNRSFALALIADMFASMVKLTSSDPMRVLSDALMKPVIDLRKLIILANNGSSLVREKVLRLFLYCIRACYAFDLRTLLNKYEQEFKGSKFKVCVPIQLMACQLLKYPTTIKMIQLCYSIIVGVDDFEAIDTVCLVFDVETIDNNLQLNILILLIQLMTQLQDPKEIVSAIRFVYTYIKQLINIGQDSVLSILVDNHLVDCLMKMYYSYVEYEVVTSKSTDTQTASNDGKNQSEELIQIRQELDKTLVLIVRYFSQNLQTSDTIRSIGDLITYFNLMNSFIIPSFHYILRDRQVKILTMAIRYCKLYESSAKQKSCGGKMEYYFKTIFRNTNNNLFPNSLRDSQLEFDFLLEDGFQFNGNPKSSTNFNNDKSLFRSRGSVDSSDTSQLSDSGSEYMDQVSFFAKTTITENDLIERYKATINLAVNFIITRDSGAIPSPFERQFIINCIRIMSDLLEEYNTLVEGRLDETSARCQWNRIIPKLEKVVRANFSRLILYLLSPCESMNLDERKYYALKLLEMFNVDRLLNLLNDDSNRNTYKVLSLFIEDLVHYDSPYNSDESESEHEDEAFGCDTEVKLKIMISTIENILGFDRKQVNKSDLTQDSNTKTNLISKTIDIKLRDIWLADLSQTIEETKERSLSMKIDHQLSITGTPVENLSKESVAVLDEALRVTHDVVNDKHEQRKIYLEELKQDKVYSYHIRQQWLSLIIGQTHERAAWHTMNHHPKSWELNPVEGPSRIRIRLRPCKLMLNSRFFRNPPSKINNTHPQNTDNKSNIEGSKVDQDDSYYRDDFLPDDWYNRYSPHPLCSMVINHEQSKNTNELRARMFTIDRINFNCDCNIIRPDEVCQGEISIATWCMHFIGERIDGYQQRLHEKSAQYEHNPSLKSTSSPKISSYFSNNKFNHSLNNQSAVITVVEDLWFDEIVEILDRRHQLKDVGLEIFLTNNMTYLLSFRTNKDREDFKQSLMKEQHKMINLQRSNSTSNLNRVIQLWREERLTNFDLLTCLNKLAGRSFNDLMQYPVFPFILSDYSSRTLDLTSESSFRNLKRPMAVQNPEKETNFIKNYEDSSSSNMFLGIQSMTKPYHYGNHYSNTATVLHFLVRLPPFTQMLIQYQDNNFDQPDRTFHSIANTWQLITNDSNTDFKELIPEFFFLPEMFINLEQFELGCKQNNELVDDVCLPPWCRNDARLFTLIHRQALESALVSDNLHHWIDLIFGYKQTGKAAVEALNVFHPATYYGMITLDNNDHDKSNSNMLNSAILSMSPRTLSQNSDMLQDNPDTSYFNGSDDNSSTLRKTHKKLGRPRVDIERMAVETMIKTYGQMPRQLFSQPLKSRVNSDLKLARLRQNSMTLQVDSSNDGQLKRKIEPLCHVIGLKWGNYVGSPDESGIVAVKHKQITQQGLCSPVKQGSPKKDINANYYLTLLPNGDIAIMRDNTSLMLDYRADRKSGNGFQLSLPSSRYSRRAGLSNVARMNLFSNMIISRQQFAYVEPTYINSGSYDSTSSNASSSFVTNPKTRFSLETLSKITWSFIDGTIRTRHPASNSSKPSVPLLQADSNVDSLSTCTSVPELNLLLVGYQSGAISAHIVSTLDETVPTSRSFSTLTKLSTDSGGPSALHFINAPTSPTILPNVVPLGPGRVRYNPLSGEQHSAISLSGKALQTVKSLNKATRWLYCHNKRINSICINVGFGVVVTASDDGTSVIWDLNSLCYVQSIDYRTELNSTRDKRSYDRHKYKRAWSNQLDENPFLSEYLCACNGNISKLDNRFSYNGPNLMKKDKQCSSCSTGVSLIAISDTLGDIATVKHFSDRVSMATDCMDSSINCETEMSYTKSADFLQNQIDSSSSSSVIYVHTINGFLVGLTSVHAKVTALCYSSAPEGRSVNVIAVGLADGLIRLYSSWDLSRVKEFHVTGLSLPPTSLLYSRDNQLLYVIYADGQLVVLRNKGGKNSTIFPKELIF